MKKVMFILFPMILISISVSFGQEDNYTPKQIVKSKIDNALKILGDTSIDQEAKVQKITDSIIDVINFELMAGLCLGKSAWVSLTAEQRDKFISLFIERLKNTYLKKLPFYSNKKVIYNEMVEKGQNKIYVPTYIESNGEKILVVYKFFRKNGQKWLIYDVEVKNVSLVSSYRSQFSDVLQTGSIEDIYEYLKKNVLK